MRPIAPRSSGSASCCCRWTTATPAVRPLLDLEGLKQWLPGRLELYQPLERAVDNAEFYDADGRITAADYRP